MDSFQKKIVNQSFTYLSDMGIYIYIYIYLFFGAMVLHTNHGYSLDTNVMYKVCNGCLRTTTQKKFISFLNIFDSRDFLIPIYIHGFLPTILLHIFLNLVQTISGVVSVFFSL